LVAERAFITGGALLAFRADGSCRWRRRGIGISIGEVINKAYVTRTSADIATRFARNI